MLSVPCPVRYRTLPLTYVTNELAFDDPTAADAFLSKWRCAIYLPIDTGTTNGTIPTGPISISLKNKPAERKPAPIDGAAGQAGSAKAGDKEANQDKRQLDCKAAHPYFLAAQQTFAKVDIKVRHTLCCRNKASQLTIHFPKGQI